MSHFIRSFVHLFVRMFVCWKVCRIFCRSDSHLVCLAVSFILMYFVYAHNSTYIYVPSYIYIFVRSSFIVLVIWVQSYNITNIPNWCFLAGWLVGWLSVLAIVQFSFLFFLLYFIIFLNESATLDVEILHTILCIFKFFYINIFSVFCIFSSRFLFFIFRCCLPYTRFGRSIE